MHDRSHGSWFYDFNTTSNERSPTFSMAGTFPLWQNITPPEVAQSEDAALKLVSGLRFLLGKYSGVPSIATLVYSGLNWVSALGTLLHPVASFLTIRISPTPGHRISVSLIVSRLCLYPYATAVLTPDTSIRTFEALGRAHPNAKTLSNLTLSFDELPSGQLGLQESELQPQPLETVGNVSLYTQEAFGKPWPLALSIEFANR